MLLKSNSKSLTLHISLLYTILYLFVFQFLSCIVTIEESENNTYSLTSQKSDTIRINVQALPNDLLNDELIIFLEEYFNELHNRRLKEDVYKVEVLDFIKYPSIHIYNLISGYDSKINQLALSAIYSVKNDTILLFNLFELDTNAEISLKASFDLGITKLRGSIQLVNPLYLNSKKLKTDKVGNIQYFYIDSLNYDNAKEMNKFNIHIAKEFNVEPIEFKYFKSKSNIDANLLNGVNYYPNMYQINNYAGFADIFNNLIFAGNNSEYYPHELIHLYTAQWKEYPNPNKFFGEGIATYFGGSRGYDLTWHICQLKNYIITNKITKEDFDLTGLPTMFAETSRTSYVIGAILCKKAYLEGGIKNVKRYFAYERNTESLYQAIFDVLGKDKETINQEIFNEIIESKCINK